MVSRWDFIRVTSVVAVLVCLITIKITHNKTLDDHTPVIVHEDETAKGDVIESDGIIVPWQEQPDFVMDHEMSDPVDIAPVNSSQPNRPKPFKVIYNSIPKSGSRTTNMALEHFAKVNHYRLVRPSYMGLGIGERHRQALIRQVQGTPPPAIFSWQFEYVNFTRYGLQEPMYINVVRNPLDREISLFYYSRFDSTYLMPETRRFMDLNMTFSQCAETRHPECNTEFSVMLQQFCAVDVTSRCGERTEESLRRAMYSLQKAYTLVGITEDMPAFFYLLEKYMPTRFHGAAEWFAKSEEKLQTRYATKARPKTITQKARDIMMENLKMDFEFYYFAKKIFYEKLSQYPYKSKTSS